MANTVRATQQVAEVLFTDSDDKAVRATQVVVELITTFTQVGPPTMAAGPHMIVISASGIN